MRTGKNELGKALMRLREEFRECCILRVGFCIVISCKPSGFENHPKTTRRKSAQELRVATKTPHQMSTQGLQVPTKLRASESTGYLSPTTHAPQGLCEVRSRALTEWRISAF